MAYKFVDILLLIVMISLPWHSNRASTTHDPFIIPRLQGMVFYPCEPSPFNFPGKYVWTAPDKQLIGSVCFR